MNTRFKILGSLGVNFIKGTGYFFSRSEAARVGVMCSRVRTSPQLPLANLFPEWSFPILFDLHRL